MNNYILINRTFSEITPESTEQGDFSDMGFIAQDEQVTFSDLVQIMREHNNPSCSPCKGDINTWFSTDFYTDDYATATMREESIHYSNNNTVNGAKYWRLAAKAAGYII